jgi:phenylacetate-CoA ligase
MSADDAFYDSLEARDPAEREREQMTALAGHVARAKDRAPYYGRILRDVDPAEMVSRDALARLPVTRKKDLVAEQGKLPPFGGLNASSPGHMARAFASPGPIYEPQGACDDYWRMARGLFAAGFRAGELVHNTFAYHLTPGGWMMDSGARALGCPVIPAGVGNTELQVQAIAQLRPSCFAGTPDYLKVLLDKADEEGLDASSIRRALVSGGALFRSLRQGYQDRGIETLQCYATAECGLIAYETAAAGGGPNEGMVVDEHVLLEIVRPGTDTPVPEGEVGEVVVTVLNPDYPLIRFSTGDLSAVLPGQSPCGRTNIRIKGWMGRADQTAKVKGMFVRPEQVDQVVQHHPEIAKARLVVERRGESDIMTLVCEVPGGDEALGRKIAESVQAFCKVKGDVALVEPGELPNDGKVIDDQRSYE